MPLIFKTNMYLQQSGSGLNMRSIEYKTLKVMNNFFTNTPLEGKGELPLGPKAIEAIQPFDAMNLTQEDETWVSSWTSPGLLHK